MFIDLDQENVSFKMSNTNEAVFDVRGSVLFSGRSESLVMTGADAKSGGVGV